MKYKIVIFDIGKTLLDKQVSNEISVQTLADIKALQSKGIKVGVCTMRTVRHCREIIPFELDFYICLNGSHITCDGKLIFDSPLEYKHDSPDYLSYGADYAFCSSAASKEKALQSGFLIDKPGVAAPVYNCVLFDVTKEHLGCFSAYNTEYWEKTKALSLQSVDSSKSLGIQKVLEYYGFDEPILYFGDGPNDLPIFQTYKDCVCMGDCYPELCQYALVQTKPCKDNGVSFALRKIGLI
jgi:hydroxymethylpyrimidine pyrophosphatase-like HAD family hydrolase